MNSFLGRTTRTFKIVVFVPHISNLALIGAYILRSNSAIRIPKLGSQRWMNSFLERAPEIVV